MANIFQLLIVSPLTNILLVIYHLLTFLHVPSALGFSIIVFTAVIRLLLYPIMSTQIKTSKKMASLSPHLGKLKEKHKGDPQKLQSATMDLYREHGVNPAAGCVPLLVQLPVLFGLYNVLQHMITLKPEQVVKTVNAVAYHPSLHLASPWSTSFFGLPLGESPSHLLAKFGPVILLIPLVTGVLQFLQTKMMLPVNTEKPKKNSEPDFATAFQTQSLYLFPAMLAFLAFQFALGLSFYWNTFTIFGMIQQFRLQGLGGLEEFAKKLKILAKK